MKLQCLPRNALYRILKLGMDLKYKGASDIWVKKVEY